MATSSIIKILFLVFFSLAILNVSLSINDSSINVGCIESEKQALSVFKQHLFDPANRLASWVQHEDCCRRWVGVVCHNVSGHVLELHLQNPTLDDDATFAESEANMRSRLGGKIHHSLLNLTHLSYLDLSYNEFGGISIPDFFGSMLSLRHLNLSIAGFGGLIPHQLGNLSNMEYLNLDEYGLHVENLGWLAGMSRLKYLHMSTVNLRNATDWLQTLNMLPSLKELHLVNSQLPPISTHLLNPNFSSLAILNLAWNNLLNTSPIMSWVFSLKTLLSLDLSANKFEGPIPDALQNLTSLRHLDLSDNQFNSSIPDWLYGFSPLEFLNLQYNNLQGKISSAIGNMTSAISLDFSENNELGGGGIPKSLGNNLCNLKSISLGGVKLSQNISDIL
ncbi:Leucine-rich repeat, typical subtype [Corchorus olitorius]|uniref:Leucine-rich repeat, typical subtype n=1 Tax=Corchorus olitorius TaxID=93759 RepID=A0A1R3KBJ6_9ROSI|nr:Leucine-rich repeat, typical subtype [Corchorus olitorius]